MKKGGRMDTSSKRKSLSRREFLGRCSGCAAGLTAFTSLNREALKNLPPVKLFNDRKRGNTKISLVMAHPSSKKPCWPNIGYDFEKNKAEFQKKIRKHCPDVEFFPVTARSDEDAQRILQSGEKTDGYVVYLSGCLVTFFGDFKRQIIQTAALLGFEMVYEA